jgi:uncharacterized membrane protein
MGLKLFGHPVHPALVHFPVALWSISLLWDGVGLILGDPLWWAMSYWSLALGVGFALPAMAAGYWDYFTIEVTAPAHPTALRHAVVMGGAASLFLVSLIARGDAQPPEGAPLIVSLVSSVVGVALLAWGGWLGGTLVYRFGVGRDDQKN